MKRTQYVAIIVGLVAIGGLVAVNLDSDDDSTAVASPPAAATDSTNDADASDSDANLADVEPESQPTTTAPLPDAPAILGEAGDLVDLDGWLQTDNTQFSDFDGTVRVVQFWTFSCVNCKNTLDNLSGLYEEFEPQGLEVIGVHAPEFDFERDPAAVAQAAIDQNVTWPIALDTDKTNFRSWQPGRRFWPRTFVLDRDGNIRFDRIGEGAYDELNATVAFLIENPAA